MSEKEEPLLMDNPQRFVIFPIQYPRLWKKYKEQQQTIWFAEDIKFENNKKEWDELSVPEKNFLKTVLAFFAASDGIVIENLIKRFLIEIQVPEARSFYSLQIQMENVHSETYSIFLDTFIDDLAEKARLFNAIETLPSVKMKADWALKWIDDKESTFAQRVIAFAIVEGVFFSGSFCAVFWMKSRGKLSGFCQANDYIARDEGLHTDFAVCLYEHLENRLDEETVHQMFTEAVEIEHQFIDDALPSDLLGINARDMKMYINFIANRLLKQLGFQELFSKAYNPFDFMEKMAVPTKNNFFEREPTEYRQNASLEIEEEDPYGFLDV